MELKWNLYKILLLIAFSFVNGIGLNAKGKYVELHNVDSIVIKYHAIDYDYPIKTVRGRINFDEDFSEGERAGFICLKNRKQINKFINLVNTQDSLPKEEIKIYPKDADEFNDPLEVVFSKIEIFYPKNTEVLWVNRFYMDIGNYRYYISREILDLIYAIPVSEPYLLKGKDLGI